MGGVVCWKVGVVERVSDAIDFDCFILAIDPMEQTAMFHMPFGMARNHLALELKLHPRCRFLHACHHHFLAHPGAFYFEPGRGIDGITRSCQQVERLYRDPIPLFQLRNTTVSERYSQNVADQCFMTKAGAQPSHVVIAPDKRDVWLLHQVVNDPVSPLTAIPAVARYDQFIDCQVSDDAACQMNQM